jgi:hypothetical protein
LFDSGGDLLDARAFGHPVVDHELGHRGVREEELVDPAEADDGESQQAKHAADGQPAGANGAAQQPPEGTIEATAIGIRGICARLRHRQELQTLQRRHRDRDHPRDHQRDADHGEQGGAVLTRTFRRHVDRKEGHHSDDRGAEQRPCRLGGRFDRRLHLSHAFLEADDIAFGDDDGVVDHHAERDHQRAQRHPLQIDAEQRHDHEGAENRHHQGTADDQSHAPAHGDGQDREHDGDRLGQVDEKAFDGLVDDVRLPVHAVDLDADRQFLEQLIQALIDRLTHLDDVDARLVGDRQGQGRQAVEPHHRGRRIAVGLANVADVANADELALPARLRLVAGLQAVEQARPDRQIGDVAGLGELPGRVDPEASVLNIQAAGVDHQILLVQRRLDALLR